MDGNRCSRPRSELTLAAVKAVLFVLIGFAGDRVSGQSLFGMVYDADGGQVSDAVVAIMSKCESENGDVVTETWTVKSGADGRFPIDVGMRHVYYYFLGPTLEFSAWKSGMKPIENVSWRFGAPPPVLRLGEDSQDLLGMPVSLLGSAVDAVVLERTQRDLLGALISSASVQESIVVHYGEGTVSIEMPTFVANACDLLTIGGVDWSLSMSGRIAGEGRPSRLPELLGSILDDAVRVTARSIDPQVPAVASCVVETKHETDGVAVVLTTDIEILQNGEVSFVVLRDGAPALRHDLGAIRTANLVGLNPIIPLSAE